MRTQVTMIAFAALVLAASTEAPQSERELLKSTPAEQRAKIQTEIMTSKLQLTEEEATKVGEVNLEYAKKADPLLEGPEGDLKLMSEMKTLGNEKLAALKNVLTDEQFQSFQSMAGEIRKEFLSQLRAQASGSK